jgi:hypothetical protein
MPVTGEIDIPAAVAAVAKRPLSAGTAQKTRSAAVEMIGQESLATPAFSYRIVPVRAVCDDVLDLGSSSIRVPGLVDVSTRLTAVAAVVSTLGAAFAARVSDLCTERKLLLAFVLDELGNELLMYTVRQALLQIRREVRGQRLSSGSSLSPGCSGFALDQQAAVVALAGGERLGISVTSQGMLHPVKSRSMIIPVGTGLSAQPLHKRCETCSSRKKCRYRGL